MMQSYSTVDNSVVVVLCIGPDGMGNNGASRAAKIKQRAPAHDNG